VAAAGYSVALSGDGATAVVGVAGDDNNQGGAWVFARSGSSWVQGPLLSPSDASSYGGSEFGASVAISGDGNTILVGAPEDDGGVYRPHQGWAGAAWVFTRSGSGWSQQGPRLTAASEQSGPPNFGMSVALAADGGTALVGGHGGAWVFTRSGSSWSQVGATLAPSDQSGQADFGVSVALSGDGGTALIGGPLDGEVTAPGGGPAVTPPHGAAWVFTPSGSGWAQQGAKLLDGSETVDRFGVAVALSGDGNTGLVGDSVFTRAGATWSQGALLMPGAASQAGILVGDTAALSSDGQTALVGGSAGNLPIAWLFARSGSSWSQQGATLAGGSSPTGAAGVSTVLSGDGQTALVGASTLSALRSTAGGGAP